MTDIPNLKKLLGSPKVTRRSDTMGGRYCLAGTRMPVVQVKRMVADVGRAWVKREFPWITDSQIDDALNFRARAALSETQADEGRG